MEREEREGSVLIRCSPEECRLLRNYRVVNDVRQETLLYFSDELVKLERLDIQAAVLNVFPIRQK